MANNEFHSKYTICDVKLNVSVSIVLITTIKTNIVVITTMTDDR